MKVQFLYQPKYSRFLNVDSDDLYDISAKRHPFMAKGCFQAVPSCMSIDNPPETSDEIVPGKRSFALTNSENRFK